MTDPASPPPNMFGGFRIYESLFLTVPKTVNRSWRERLFSWPWRPFVTVKQIQVPSPTMHQVGDNVYGHPATIAALREELRKKGMAHV